MNNKGKIIACDIYENRLNLVNEYAKRLGINIIETRVNDGTILNNEFVNKFDKVLVDAPCSGIGVIRRKVDIKYKRKKEDFEEIANIQYMILENASKYVKKGGYIVYSTCTILSMENEEIIQRFLNKYNDFIVIDISNEIKDNQLSDKYIKTLPYKSNMDGFFIAKLQKI